MSEVLKRELKWLISEVSASKPGIGSLGLAYPQRPRKDAEFPQAVFPLLKVSSLLVRQAPLNNAGQSLGVRVTTSQKLVVLYPLPPEIVENLENS